MGYNIILIYTVIVTHTLYNVAGELLRVKVAQGWLEGEWLQTVTGNAKYCSFKGIPYAQPPLGKLRFKAPLPPVPWNGIRNATEHGSICPQIDLFTRAFIPGNEDCLFLNVYTRNVKPENKMPVIFFIHGGNFQSGSGNVDFYGPDFLVERNVVVVTINYRLDVLGFLCMNTDDVPGNAGLKDQVAALRWVNENIEHFGGDPKCVTIMGHSVGGASVSSHLLSPMTRGLFKRVIAMSGSPFCEWAVPVAAAKRPYIIGKELGLDTKDPKKLLRFLQSVSVEKLIKVYPSVISSENLAENIIFRYFHHTPVIETAGEDNYLNETVFRSLKDRKVQNADVFYGHTDKESIFYIKPIIRNFLKKYDRYLELLVQKKMYSIAPLDAIVKAADVVRNHYFGNKTINMGVLEEFVTFMDHINFIYDIHNFIDMLPKIGDCGRYFYRFSALSDRNYYGKAGEKYGINGVAHNDDLYYLFDPKGLNMTITKCSREYRLVQLTTSIFTNFVKYGNPTPDSSLGVNWPEYNKTTRCSVDINDRLTVRRHEDAKIVEFWDKVYGDYKQQVYMNY